ncbi:hypothetical protein [Alteromonas sp. A079]|uniref:hypothetical protein n=1 Tax=Alteromonas sp. A079 TaxID=3410268 RepID=UPI003BA09036
MLLNILGAVIGMILGAIAAFFVLFVGTYLVSLFIEDQTALGWVWVLYILCVPAGALAGLPLGYEYIGNALHRLKA